jgi:hypothetical protein
MSQQTLRENKPGKRDKTHFKRDGLHLHIQDGKQKQSQKYSNIQI